MTRLSHPARPLCLAAYALVHEARVSMPVWMHRVAPPTPPLADPWCRREAECFRREERSRQCGCPCRNLPRCQTSGEYIHVTASQCDEVLKCSAHRFQAISLAVCSSMFLHVCDVLVKRTSHVVTNRIPSIKQSQTCRHASMYSSL